MLTEAEKDFWVTFLMALVLALALGLFALLWMVP